MKLCLRLSPLLAYRRVGSMRGFSSDPSRNSKTDLVLIESQNNVRRLVLNNPRRMNILSLDMLEQLEQALVDASHDSDLRAVILAAQPPMFSSGHDLKELRSETGKKHHARVFDMCSKVMKLVQDIQLPVIAEVKGDAAAAGCQLAASCDIVVASEEARFSTPGIKFGLFCSTPGVAISRAVPRKVAMDMLLTGDMISAQAALQAGLVSRVVPKDAVEEEVQKIITTISSYSRPVVALGKSAFYSQLNLDRNSAYRVAEKVMLENLRLEDCQEGITAFVNKRSPEWSHSTKTVL